MVIGGGVTPEPAAVHLPACLPVPSEVSGNLSRGCHLPRALCLLLSSPRLRLPHPRVVFLLPHAKP